jgi:hypothetical protein
MDWAIGELGQVENGTHKPADNNPRICLYRSFARDLRQRAQDRKLRSS